MKKYSFDKATKFRGKWWVPGADEHHAIGTLRYTPEAISLILRGGIGTEPESHDFQHFDIVHGTADDGTKITLVGVLQNGMKHTSHGTRLSKFSTEIVVVGYHVASRDDFLVSTVRFGGRSLDWFVFGEVPKTNFGPKYCDIDINYKRPETLSYRLNAIESNLTIDGMFHNNTKGRFVTEVSVFNVFQLIPDRPQRCNDLLDEVMKCCHLITLFTNYACIPTWMQAKVGTDKSLVSLLFKRHTISQRDGEDWLTFLFDLRQINDRFGPVLNKWLGESATFWNAVYQFIDCRMPKTGGSLEPRFQMATQVLEAFSRATTDSKYMPETEYAEVINKINSNIPLNVIEDHRISLTNRIKYGNEYSLRKRLSLLLGSLGDECKSLVCNCAQNFIAGTVDSRNCLVHSSEELSATALTGGDLYWAIEKLVMLARILMLKHVGLNEAEIATAIKSHPALNQYKGLWVNRREVNKEKKST